ncbi:MAG TPA: response regulator, partial [Polyangiaceae bacterium]|nr:response regulator [Polyangiaceae bacterium]
GRSIEGSGIGLALVRELVKLHGGRVSVTSEVARGSEFRVWLPRGVSHLPSHRIGAPRTLTSTELRQRAYVEEALGWLPAEEAPTVPDFVAPSFDGNRKRVLLVEDNADMRAYLFRLLEKAYEVEAVSGGEEALALARSAPPALILSDVMMPGLDGFGLLREVRADPKLSAVPVILLSARAGEGARVDGLRQGADDYLVKPFSARELLARIAARLELSRLEQERRSAERALHEEERTLEAMNLVGRMLTAELDIERIVQAVTDAATELTGAAFGAFFYNVTNEAGESFRLYTLSGAPREAFEKFGMPRNTPVFAPTFKGEGPVRSDDITSDPRYGTVAPHFGMPKGHLPVRSYLALPVVSRTGEVVGGLFFGHPERGVFTERSERIVVGLAAHAAAALDSARLYQQRTELIDKLSESDRRKDEFLATLSHELRNPLAPLQNALYGLRLADDRGPASDRLREVMERQVGHLVRLVDDLLEVSRISRGAFELRRERVEVAAVVRNAVETSEPLLRASRHELEIVLPDAPLWVDGDATRLVQILATLLNNSAKYTPAGGHVTLRAERRGESVLLSVRDDGIGLSPDAIPRLFEMFNRGSFTLGGQGGLGIGLALVKKLAEMHGGLVHAKSDGPGKGAEFTVELPLARGNSESEPVPESMGAAKRAKRVLVVDDNVDAAETLALLLEALGAETRVAHDGASALAEYPRFEPELVLLDIGMPGMDGHEVARRLRAADPARKAVLVALTGWGQAEDRRLAREAGFDEHLVKPAGLEALKAILALSGAKAAPA